MTSCKVAARRTSRAPHLARSTTLPFRSEAHKWTSHGRWKARLFNLFVETIRGSTRVRIALTTDTCIHFSLGIQKGTRLTTPLIGSTPLAKFTTMELVSMNGQYLMLGACTATCSTSTHCGVSDSIKRTGSRGLGICLHDSKEVTCLPVNGCVQFPQSN